MSLSLFKKTSCLLPAMLLMVVAGFAQTNYYVSPSGSDANSGLVGFPKKTINAAIGAASANDTVNAAAGTYTENVLINKSLVLKGANYNVSCTGNRGAESTVSGVGGSTLSAITVDANGVTVNGFRATHPNGSYGILITGRSNVNIMHNVVTDVGNNVSGFSSSYGIFDQIITAAGNNSSNVNISSNCVSDIRGGENPTLTGAAARSNNGSAGGIGVGDSQGQSDVSGVSINGNTINDITASTKPFVDGGKGVYGVLINLGAAVTAVGKAVSPRVTNNAITNLEALWAHGVGLEGETPGAVVLNNYMNGFTDHIGGDATGAFVQDNAGAATVQIHENSFTNMMLGVVNATLDSVNATCNWYGSANATVVASRNLGRVKYTPWLTNGTDNAPGTIGFQPVPGNCNGGLPISCTVVATPSNSTYTGGVPTNLYIGYGPQSATLSVNLSSGSAVTYAWSGPTAYLSCTSCANPVFTPTQPGLYTFTVTVTNNQGGSSTCTITFCVKDIRDLGSNGKVFVCHAPPGNPANAKTHSLPPSAVPAHLGNHPGDRLGTCDQTSCGSPITARLIATQLTEEVKVYPNPNNGSFTVQLPVFEGQSQILVTDVQGKVISKKTVTEDDGQQINLNLGDAARGVYFLEVISGDQHFRTKVLIQ